ncbi:MAG: TonB-dependent receptor [Gemmatimonadetes bacterium]|nr:TonB-dependent receptor [Gemmatimonadota bacterium]
MTATPVIAQQDSTAARDTLRVRPIIPLRAITVTGVLNPAPQNQLGFALSVLSREDLLAEPRLFATDALRRLPGTFIDEAAGPGGPTIIRLRGGEEVFTQILADGIQLNENGGFFDFQGVTLTNVDRVEVARGPQSAMYGSSAVSGVVNFITRTGMVGRPRFEFTSEGGGASNNGGSFRTTLTTTGGSSKLLYSAGAGVTYFRGIYDLPNDTWSRDGSLRIDALPSDVVNITGLFRFIGQDSKLPVRDPGATRVPLDPNARDARDRFAGSVHATFKPGSRWQHRVGATVLRDDFVFEDEFDGVVLPDPPPFFVFDANLKFEADLWRTKVDYVGTVSPEVSNSTDLTFSYGAAWEREDVANTITGDFEDASEFARSSGAVFGEVQARFGDRLSIVAGGRLEKFQEIDADFSPKASAVLHVVPQTLALRTAVGRAFKAPNLQQQFVDNPFIVSNPDLEPETSTSWEVGATVSDRRARFMASATYFRQLFKNLIRAVDLGDGTGRQINRNIGESEAQGVEFEVQVRPTNKVLAGVNGTWIRTEILENDGLPSGEFPLDSALPFRPKWVGTAFLQVAVGRRLSGVVRGRYVGSQIVLSERFSGTREDIDPYFLTDLTATYNLRTNLSLYARAENLFDVSYHTAFDRMGIPLTLAVGARIVR